MKNHILSFISLLFIAGTSLCQTVERTQLSSVTFDPSGRIYNKFTGKKISEEEFAAYIKHNSRVSFDHEINKFGQVVKYLLDTTSRSSSKLLNTEEMEEGMVFPEFVFKTIDGKKIKSKDLKGKWVVLRFENYLRFDSLSIHEFDEELKDNGRDDITYISCFQESKTELAEIFNGKTPGFHLVPNAHNFFLKYKIALNPDALPTTIVVDSKGEVFKYYIPGEVLDWESFTDR